MGNLVILFVHFLATVVVCSPLTDSRHYLFVAQLESAVDDNGRHYRPSTTTAIRTTEPQTDLT
jgi:hypothetical protein